MSSVNIDNIGPIEISDGAAREISRSGFEPSDLFGELRHDGGYPRVTDEAEIGNGICVRSVRIDRVADILIVSRANDAVPIVLLPSEAVANPRLLTV